MLSTSLRFTIGCSLMLVIGAPEFLWLPARKGSTRLGLPDDAGWVADDGCRVVRWVDASARCGDGWLVARGVILGLFFQGVEVGGGDEVLGTRGAGGRCEVGADHLLALALGGELVVDAVEVGCEFLQLLATGAAARFLELG